MSIITYKFKIKSCQSRLNVLATKVNFIWNYCNSTSFKATQDGKFLSDYDLHYLLAGTSKILNISAQTAQAVAEQYVQSRKTHKKRKLKWRNSRGPKRSLGWIPFKYQSIKVTDKSIIYRKKKYRYHKSQEMIGKLKCGSFVQDSCGDWFICLTYEQEKINIKHNDLTIGVDLGIKNIVTTSDGYKFPNPKLTQKWAKKLAIAQKTNNKKRVSRLHRKLARTRKDNLHKISYSLTRQYGTIIVGDLKLKSNKLTNDASFRGLIPLLKYKASRLNGTVLEVNEAFSTKTCSNCLAETGPFGVDGLAIREWACVSCGQIHDRDINGAKNILRFGYKALKTLNEPMASLNEELSINIDKYQTMRKKDVKKFDSCVKI